MFEIKCGMFQGDTLSPVIFLTVFNPLIELSSRLTTTGFSLKVPVPNSVGLPPVNSATYVYWDENSDESCWMVLCSSEKKHLSDGTTNIKYANKDTETVNLHSVKWDPQEKDKNRIFLATENHLSFYLKRSERKPLNRNSIHPASLSAKAFADDLHLKITNPSC